MSTAEINADPMSLDTPAIKKAKAWLARGTGLTLPEQSEARGMMERAGSDSLECKILSAIVNEIDARSAQATAEMSAKSVAAIYEKRNQREREKPLRWAALPPLERAAHLVADEFGGGLEGKLGRALIKLARLAAADEYTAKKTPPDSFEPPQW
jgi:hypothetical protein